MQEDSWSQLIAVDKTLQVARRFSAIDYVSWDWDYNLSERKTVSLSNTRGTERSYQRAKNIDPQHEA